MQLTGQLAGAERAGPTIFLARGPNEAISEAELGNLIIPAGQCWHEFYSPGQGRESNLRVPDSNPEQLWFGREDS